MTGRTPARGSSAASSAFTRSRRRCAGQASTGWRGSHGGSGSRTARGSGASGPTPCASTFCAHAWNDGAGAFTSSYGSGDLDATALLLPELGLIEASDPRFTATLAAIERDLKDGDWLYRYRHAR